MAYATQDVLDIFIGLEPPFESEVVELKEAKSSFKFNELGQYFGTGKSATWVTV